jgi:hypothetical protein
MGSRYLFIVLYVFLEQHLTRGDYRRPAHAVTRPSRFDPGEPGRTRGLVRSLPARRRR